MTAFTTDRLSLEILTTRHWAFIRELVNTEGWLRFIGDRNVLSHEDAIAYINKINNTPNLTYWIVCLKETNAPIGIITFLKRNYLEHFDIGFAFLPAYNRQGYAYEAAREVLSHVTQMPEHRIVLATTISENASSIMLLKKLGFHFEKKVDTGGLELEVYSNANDDDQE